MEEPSRRVKSGNISTLKKKKKESEKKIMQMNIFGKQVSHEGRTFATYFTRLTNTKTGETKSFNVKFRQEASQPDIFDCPCIIEVPREKMNLQEKVIYDKETDLPVTDEDGNVKISNNIWISQWSMVGPYVDHALDDYE